MSKFIALEGVCQGGCKVPMAEKSVGSGQLAVGRKGFEPVNSQPLTVNGGKQAGSRRLETVKNRESEGPKQVRDFRR